jgi:hypothetical protein
MATACSPGSRRLLLSPDAQGTLGHGAMRPSGREQGGDREPRPDRHDARLPGRLILGPPLIAQLSPTAGRSARHPPHGRYGGAYAFMRASSPTERGSSTTARATLVHALACRAGGLLNVEARPPPQPVVQQQGNGVRALLLCLGRCAGGRSVAGPLPDLGARLARPRLPVATLFRHPPPDARGACKGRRAAGMWPRGPDEHKMFVQGRIGHDRQRDPRASRAGEAPAAARLCGGACNRSF